MAVINTNVKALFSQAALSSSSRAQTVAMQQLSTGKRINTSRDDAAGMAIATRMTNQIRSMNQAIRNANDALSMLQTAESATTTINDMLTRMRELAIQATNDSNSNDQRSYLDLEFQQLKKEIVAVSEKVEYNGFPLLNGKAGTPVGEMPVFKVTSDGKYDSAVTVSVTEKKSSFTTGGTGTLAKSGTLSIQLDATPYVQAAGDATKNTAKITLDDGTVIDVSDKMVVSGASGASSKITFTDSALTDKYGTFEISAGTGFANSELVTVKLGREFAKLPTMRTGDLIINGEAVPSSTSVDSVSPTDGAKANNLGSAIARAAAINEVSDRTGVMAVVQKNVVTGTAMDPALNSTTPGKGTVTINGYITGVITTTPNNVRASREETVRQINKISHLTGVVAVDTGVDSQGVTLTAADGRNIEVAFNTANTASDFAALTGLKQGISVGTYALESKVEQQIVVTSAPAGDISTTGLRLGDYTQNISREITSDRAATYSPVAKVVKVTPAGAVATSLTLNGIKVDVASAAQGVQATALASSINSDATLKAKVTATAVGNDVFITAKDPGVDFTTATSDANLTATTVVENTVGSNRALRQGDLVINGVTIPGGLETSDILTDKTARSSDNSGSAISIAAAINSKTSQTGVTAVANAAVMSATSAIESNLPQSGFYSIYVNGTQVVVQLNPDDSPDVRMNRIIAELKKHEGQTGVEGSINKAGGLELRTVDGRNLSVWLDPTQTASDGTAQVIRASMFGLATGTPSGQPQTTRLTLGTTSTNGVVSVKINNTTINAKVLSTYTADQVAGAVKDAIQTAIDSKDSNLLGLKIGTYTAGDGFLELTNADPNLNYQNPFEVKVLSTPESQFVATVKTQAVKPGKDAASAYYWDSSATAKFIDPVAGNVLAVENADTLASTGAKINAKTLYGSVTLKSDKAYTIAPGSNGLGIDSSFAQLGFQAGTFGGASDVAMSPPRVGRMTFQVGSSVGNDISFDLADFGKNGPITQLITWDVGLANLKPGDSIPTPDKDSPIFEGKKLTRSFIGSKDGALEVLSKLDATMDKVSAQRATMGSIMNRLDQVVTNLTNVSMNMSASRSQIEDADYAAASTELAKTQIMQQAATAVLAQANTSQQSVLKLLGG